MTDKAGVYLGLHFRIRRISHSGTAHGWRARRVTEETRDGGAQTRPASGLVSVVSTRPPPANPAERPSRPSGRRGPRRRERQTPTQKKKKSMPRFSFAASRGAATVSAAALLLCLSSTHLAEAANGETPRGPPSAASPSVPPAPTSQHTLTPPLTRLAFPILWTTNKKIDAHLRAQRTTPS